MYGSGKECLRAKKKAAKIASRVALRSTVCRLESLLGKKQDSEEKRVYLLASIFNSARQTVIAWFLNSPKYSGVP